MVKKTILVDLLKRVPEALLVSFCQELETMPPTNEQINFVEWATKMRVRLDLTQEQVANGTAIGQEEISKFERGIISFGKKRQNKLKDFFRSKSLVGEEEFNP